MNRYSNTRQRGVTAIEALIAMSGVLVVVALTVPAIGQRTARSEMNTAVEILQASIVSARQNARIYQTDVVMSVQNELGESSTLSYVVRPPHQSEQAIDFQAQNYQLPPGVRLTTDRDKIQFNASGEVVPPALLELVSTGDDIVREQILLQ
jgi:Tfp pilus assembly protein FimT